MIRPKIKLKLIRPKSNNIYNCHNPKGIRPITRLSLKLSHLCKHKFIDSFQDYLNPLYSCGNDIETSSQYLILCPITKTPVIALFAILQILLLYIQPLTMSQLPKDLIVPLLLNYKNKKALSSMFQFFLKFNLFSYLTAFKFSLVKNFSDYLVIVNFLRLNVQMFFIGRKPKLGVK